MSKQGSNGDRRSSISNVFYLTQSFGNQLNKLRNGAQVTFYKYNICKPINPEILYV